MARGNPNPKTDQLRPMPKTRPGEKSVALRIWSTVEALDAFTVLSPQERGEIIQRWFDHQEPNHE